MKSLTWQDTVEISVKHHNKWAVKIGNHLTFDKTDDCAIWENIIEQLKAKFPKAYNQLMVDVIESNIVLFCSKAKAVKFFNIFNSRMTYAGPVYAQLVSKKGIALTENT